MKFRPLHDRVVVKRIEAEEKTVGGIIIPDTAKEKPQQGEVIAVGPGGRDETGKLIPIDFQAGDRVLFGIARSLLHPDLPTMDEAGVTGFNLDAWAGLVAPAGTPAPIVTKLNGALRNVIDTPDVQAKFKTIGFEGFSSTPEELGAFIKVQLGVWGKMVKDAGINPD
jgi:co-chaperonin GroES (HSP10)